MEVKELVKNIKELNIESCTGCPFYKRDDCKLHGVACIVNKNLGLAESILQLEHFFKTGEVKEILEEEEND
ncbi:MAG: hypothetical protein ACLR02_09970 [Clostridium sp.]